MEFQSWSAKSAPGQKLYYEVPYISLSSSWASSPSSCPTSCNTRPTLRRPEAACWGWPGDEPLHGAVRHQGQRLPAAGPAPALAAHRVLAGLSLGDLQHGLSTQSLTAWLVAGAGTNNLWSQRRSYATWARNEPSRSFHNHREGLLRY